MSRRPTPAARPGSPLEEVRRLEAAEEQRQRADDEAQARLAGARREAKSIVAAARANGEREAQRRRAALLAAADRDAEQILREGRKLAARARHRFERRLPDLVGEALRLILPGASGPSGGQPAAGRR
jgi:F0F1-type ATP synthase membrane subunit b/b'